MHSLFKDVIEWRKVLIINWGWEFSSLEFKEHDNGWLVECANTMDDILRLFAIKGVSISSPLE